MIQKNPKPKNIHKISWPMKIAFVLAFLPFCLLIAALIFKWWLPTFPFLNLTGSNPPEHIIFMANNASNLPGAVYFSVICFIIGIGLFSYLAIDRGSIKSAWRDCLDNLKKDFSELLNTTPKDKPQTPAPTQKTEEKKVVHISRLVAKRRIPKTPETIL